MSKISQKEIAMRAIGNAIMMCIRAVETMPARGNNPPYMLGYTDCRTNACKRLAQVMAQTLRDIEQQNIGDRQNDINSSTGSSGPGTSNDDAGTVPIAIASR
jgi:hypothetical protein